MGLIDICQIVPGMVLESDLFAPNGRFLLSANSLIEKKQIKIFKTWGVLQANVLGHSKEEFSPRTEIFHDPSRAELNKIDQISKISRIKQNTPESGDSPPPHSPDLQNETKRPGLSKISEISETSKISNIPETQEIPKNLKTLEISKTLEIPKIPKDSQAANISETQKIPNVPDIPEVQKISEPAKITETPNIPEVTKLSESGETTFLKNLVKQLIEDKREAMKALEVAAALGTFETTLNQLESKSDILRETTMKIRNLIKSKAISIFLVHEVEGSFFPAYWDPKDCLKKFEKEAEILIENGCFAEAIKRNRPILLPSIDKKNQLLVHALSTNSRTRGMFFALLEQDPNEIFDAFFSLLTIILHSTAHMLESYEFYSLNLVAKKKLEQSVQRLEESEKELIRHRYFLEEQVMERTKALAESNEKMRNEISERKAAEIALKESQEKYQLAVKAGKVGVWSLDLIDENMFIDPNLKEMLGYSENETFNSFSTWKELIHQDDRESFEKIFKDFLEGHSEELVFEHRKIDKKGGIKWILSRGSFAKGGNRNRLIGTDIDITEAQIALEEKRKLEIQLRKSQRLETVGRLAGGIAHDFNNLLTPILGYSDMLASNPIFEEKVRNQLKSIVIASTRAKDIIKQLLFFGGQMEQVFKPIEIQKIILEAIHLIRVSIPTTIEIRSDIAPDCKPILGDSSQMSQVIMNLCANASHAMRERGGILNISLENHEICQKDRKVFPEIKDGHYTKLVVKDNGYGMDPSTIERIFEPFFTTKGVGGGSGLGLWVVHGIVSNHQGFIHVESELGKGTEFKLLFPSTESQVAINKVEEKTVSFTGNECILMVDDETEITLMGKRTLEKFGYQIFTENEPIKALQVISENPKKFQLLITDQTMPGLTGLELAKKTRQMGIEMPIILVTGYNDRLSQNSQDAKLISRSLMKPFSIRNLAMAIRQTLDEKMEKRGNGKNPNN
ncbi:MAG: PAS domain-containing protein [Candidatus Riflebacteria bacterium]|nr:PAS domain-containing protein [Candidatus Riflebacteria bacterium]